jgi:hypothetical protein
MADIPLLCVRDDFSTHNLNRTSSAPAEPDGAMNPAGSAVR